MYVVLNYSDQFFIKKNSETKMAASSLLILHKRSLGLMLFSIITNLPDANMSMCAYVRKYVEPYPRSKKTLGLW